MQIEFSRNAVFVIIHFEISVLKHKHEHNHLGVVEISKQKKNE